MQTNEDGNITLSKEEFAKLNKAYQALYKIIDSMPSSIQDYFYNKASWLNVELWQCVLNGKKFNLKDYE